MLPAPLLVPQCCSGLKSHGKVHREQGLRSHSVTCGNFNPFSFAHRETGWHRPPALQPPGSKTHQRSCSAVISPPHTVLPQQKPHSMQINHPIAHEQLCPIPFLSRAAGTLQPVYPDFTQQLQLLQHHGVSRNSSTQEVKEHSGQLRCRAKALAAGWMQEPEDRECPSGKVALPGPREGAPGGGIPLPAPGMAPCLQQACKGSSCQLS